MRRPTPRDQLLAWHARRLQDPRTPRHDGWPECGYYRVKTGKEGLYAPLLIALVQVTDEETGELIEPERLRGVLAGQPIDVEKLHRLWLFAQAITREAFKDLLDRRASPERPRAPILPTRRIPQ